MSYPYLLTPEKQLADAKDRLRIPKIVCICGSTRFIAEMAEADLRLTAGSATVPPAIVVRPGVDMKAEQPLWGSLGKPVRFTHPEVDPDNAPAT
ncbi:hypothetical protein [Streptomyces sp. NRRL F-5135]|uniref:hypothetical protein n=1 Tax=Streptomyces sp. NRRL F-5135 TaxID=1463858 RepID=UPI0004C73904|nr:hypothetical protein [Streptomyces sp. NRRL F-5135]